MRRGFFAALVLLTTGATGAGAGDLERGEALARRICAECHAVLPGQSRSSRADAASFEDIAQAPGMSALALTVWLTTPHREMPNLILSEQEREDVIAYIVSLKR